MVVSVNDKVHFSVQMKEVAELNGGDDVILSYGLHTQNISGQSTSISLSLSL